MEHFAPADLHDFAEHVLGMLGVAEGDAWTVADSLIAANLRGVDTHGIQLLPVYVRRLVAGVVEPRPKLRTVAEGPAFAVVDGGNGLGPVVGAYAMDKAVALARGAGVAAVAARHSNHFGAAAWYADRAAAQRMIGIAMSNGTPALAPWGGRRPFFGADPVAVAVPAAEEPPVVFDMASSVSSRARIRQAAARGDTIPEGWAVDRQGRPTTNAADALAGALLPVGGPKGYGLTLILELLAGGLTGATFSPENRDLHADLSGPQGLGHFFLVLDPERFLPGGNFGKRADWLIRELHESAPADGVSRVRVPGDLDAQRRAERLARGIAVAPEVVAELETVGERAGTRLRRPNA